MDTLPLFDVEPDVDAVERRRAVSARNAAYYAANAERLRIASRERSARRYAEKRDEILAQQRVRYSENPRPKLDRNKAARDADPDKARRWARNWRDSNRAKARAAYLRRRTREREGQAFLVLDRDVRRILSSSCLACGSTDNVTIDHRIPLARQGGYDGVGNYAPLCGPCNSSKRDMTYAEWKYSDRPRARLVFGPTEKENAA